MRFLLTIILLLNLIACSREPTSKDNQMVVTSSTFSNTLYYSGSIQPLNTVVIQSPVDGVVVDMPFQYGEAVKANQLLFQISSTKFFTDYKAALMQYIKAKSDFTTSKTLLSEAKFLHRNQLISDDDYKMKQSSYYATQLTLLQAKDALEILLHQMNIKNINLYHLTIADVDSITKVMHLQMNNENLRIVAPVEGVILSASKNENEAKRTMQGDAIKQGEVLAVIGDMHGINVRIKVNELTVNQLTLGQKVKITGIAFPEEILDGKITRIDRQGEMSSNGFPTFNVEVSVFQLNKIQQQTIHVGMSAKIQIDIKQGSQILVPLVAVSEKNGESFVQALDKQTGKIQLVAVQTGKTTIDSVAILNGLHPGDKIVLPH